MFNEPSQSPSIRRIAIVGSGLSGLTAAILLQEQGHDVTVFEKSRGPGGRLAAKRVSGGSADIGAQYFTARNPEFLPFLSRYAGENSFARWHGRLGFLKADGQWDSFTDAARYVGQPRMTAVSRALSNHVNVVAGVRVGKLRSAGAGWRVEDDAGNVQGDFDQVVVTAPPAQARELLVQSELDHLAAELDEPVQRVLPCWAVAAHFTESPWSQHDGMRVEHPVLYWIANNSSKPGRNDDGEWWVLHAAAEWTRRHVDTPAEQVGQALVDAFLELTQSAAAPSQVVTHRWLYARSEDGVRPGHLWFPESNLGIAGDWLSGGRVEGAFNSASSLVAAMRGVASS